mgnify:CR=1 FL=1
MTATLSETEVLIIGAGPTGLVAAAELAARGVRCRLVDKAAERSDKSRALVLQPRSLEVLQKMGALGDLLERGQRSRAVDVHANGRHVAHAEWEDLGFTDSPFPFLLFVSQAETERVLDAHARACGVTVERERELVSLAQDEAGVEVELKGPAGVERVRARWLIGADGAHSAVRQACGLRFDGDAYPQDFVLADVDVEWEYPRGGVHFFFSKSGVFVLLPMQGERAWRLLTVRERGDEGAEPTLEEFQRRAEASGLTARFSNPRWLTRFRLHHRGVDRYRHGRVFVAGDAAHIHSPAGGQGMNTGIQDAFNLAWKLALVVKGRGGEALLDSYHLERHPVGQRLLSFTDRFFRLGTSDNWLVSQARWLGGPAAVSFVLNDDGLRRRALHFTSQLGIRYRKSPLTEEPKRRGSLQRTPCAGARAPDAKLSGTTVHAQLRGNTFHLLCFGLPAQAQPQVAAALEGFEAVVHPVFFNAPDDGHAPPQALRDGGGEAFARYGVREQGLVLVRPDGHLATRAPGADPAPIRADLVEHLSRR